MSSDFITRHTKELVIIGLLVLGSISYVPTYIFVLNDFDDKTERPFVECAEYLRSVGNNEGVFTMHPDLLDRYYDGPIHKIPEKGGFEYIFEEAKKKGAKYALIESTCITSIELIELYYHSVDPSWSQIPSEFVLMKVSKWEYGVYYIQTETTFKTAIFATSQWAAATPWKPTLAAIGASTTDFEDSTSLLNINFTDYDIVIFADFSRPLNDTERIHLEESIENGLTVIVSGLSPAYLASGTSNLTEISSWFGATLFTEAPKEERWKTKFTENAIDIMDELDLERQYEFYTDSDWSTPTGCVTGLDAVVYAHRQNDMAATIFSHGYGNGTSVFIGPRFGFDSTDAETFNTFLRSLILSLFE